MSEDKTPQDAPTAGNGNQPTDNPLEQAMAEAVASMEQREREASDDIEAPVIDSEEEDEGEGEGEGEVEVGLDVEVEAEAPKKDAGAAVTEALIEAKRELENALKQTQKEAEGFREKWLRAAADLENYRKRAKKERDGIEKFANEKLLKDLLPILDDLDRALEMVGEPPEGAAQIVDGMKLLHKKFIAQLEKHSVTTFESVGEVFDPSLHEAVQQVNSEQPPGMVAVELQRGFMISGRLLRPALVTVSLGPAKAGASEPEGEAPEAK